MCGYYPSLYRPEESMARRPSTSLSLLTGRDQNAYLKKKEEEEEAAGWGGGGCLHRIVCSLQSASVADTKMLGAGNLFPGSGPLCHLGG